jgi:hypothetical protein
MNAHATFCDDDSVHEPALAILAIERVAALLPDVEMITHEPYIGDAQADTIQIWIDDFADGDECAFMLERFEEVLTAFCVAHLCTFAYARDCGPGLWLTDRGGAVAIRRARDAVAALAVAIHGEPGRALVLRERAADEQRVRDIGRALGVRWR